MSDLIQNVVKAWYSKKDVIHQAIQANHDLANRMWTAIHHGRMKIPMKHKML